MPRYFLRFSYDGTAYHGWQVQPNAMSVQQQLDRALTTLLRAEIHTTGAGRTDTGVHAACMVAHFDVETAIADLERMADKLNRLLPPDIAVSDLREVAPTAHARFDATARTYHYYVYMGKQPFLRHFATRLFFRPDFERMNAAAQILFEYTDFTSFSKLHTDVKTNICHIKHARWVQVGPDYWRFEITADRFLRNMVRAIVGTLLDVGRGRLDLEGFRQVITEENRCRAGESVPAHGLSLVDVAYDDELGKALEIGSQE
ncbi:MAG: tRNA pseudouridine(38-40) synthase TruA [Alloprevotella sp.]|nr:tRNA pseudouridine(38-40) synthase TruA [Alloprevotella sp.]